MRLFLFLLLSLASMSSFADRLTIERLHSDPALSGPGLRDLKMSPDGARVTFLRGRDDDQFQFDLWEYNLHDKAMRRLLDSKLLVPEENISDAEKARRERERTALFHGISDYNWSPDGKRLLVSLAGGLYLADVAHPEQAKRIVSGDVIDPKISPKGHFVSFVRDQNLFVVDLADGKEKQLTADGGGTIHNAEAEFVAQEEMAQSSGYWWAPDDSAIAFKHFDEAPVPVARRFEIYATRTEVVEQRYPAAGDPNVLVGLSIVAPTGGAIKNVDLGADKDIYLVRADWSADGHQLLYQRQTRDQKKLDLVAVDAATLTQRTLITETSQTWVHVGDHPNFLSKSKTFIWPSDRSGNRHLYLYDLDGHLLHTLSKGEWRVDNVLAVDEKAGRVYVASNRDAAIDKQVYALALDGSTADKPLRVTQADGWHDAHFSDHGEAFIDTWSDSDTPPQVSLRKADGSLITWLEHNELNAAHPYAPFRAMHVQTEFGVLKANDGQDMHYALMKPHNFDASKRYPVFVYVYGGPGAQEVTRQWSGRNLFFEYMAQQGYVVFRLDNRGSTRRERRFTDVIYQDLGKHEVEDQLTGIDWLAKQSFVDPKRIGVFGWSYGGFMTLRLLEAGSDRIALGAAVAPVTDWALYDTHYTERYMTRPKDNADGYKDSSVLTHLDGLKSPLLLVHGMADDNVLFVNSTRLMSELEDRGVLFDLMTYPGAKHGLSKKSSQIHVYKTIERFFDSHFGVGEVAK
ncbi:MAG: S9 family peptidase [Burkholderiaceae bacterium]|nr:S9 family peptidase [Burkholderiaceae bacterium]